MKKAYIILADGHIFEGNFFGDDRPVTGELVFTTGMGGYIETLTDPSYFGQIIMQTFPLIGNYGFIPEDCESESCFARGYIVHDQCETPSNFRSGGTVGDFLKNHGITAVCGVDTRALTLLIREHGVMNAAITDALPDDMAGFLNKLSEYRVSGSVEAVSTKKEIIFAAEGEQKYRVALYDFGHKMNIVRSLTKRGCEVTLLPFDTHAQYVISRGFDGVMLSNGPGDPADNTKVVEEIRKLFGKIPMFGICLGHQLLALAAGAKTEKLKYGHRGVNQPVKELSCGRVYISSQNHGYAVKGESLEKIGAKQSFINANDGTNEGAFYPGKMAFSVQFHPEACSGPKDTEFLFDRFIKLMEEGE